MASKEFNQSIDDYIQRVRANRGRIQSQKAGHARQVKKEAGVPRQISKSSVYVIKKPKTGWQKLKERISPTTEVDFEERRKMETKKTVSEEQEFEQEYDEMEKQTKKRGFFSRLASLFASGVDDSYKDMDDEKFANEKPAAAQKRQETPKIQIIEDEPAQKENRARGKSKSIFSKMSELFGIGDGEDGEGSGDIDEAQVNDAVLVQQMKDDFKVVASLAVAAIKKLPKDEFGKVKSSQEFVKFKEILKKYGIAKEK